MSFIYQNPTNNSNFFYNSDEKSYNSIQNVFSQAKGKFNIKYDVLIKKIADSCNVEKQQNNGRLFTSPANDYPRSYRDSSSSTYNSINPDTKNKTPLLTDLVCQTKLKFLTGQINTTLKTQPRIKRNYSSRQTLTQYDSYSNNSTSLNSTRNLYSITKRPNNINLKKSEEMRGIKRLLRNKNVTINTSIFGNPIKRREMEAKKNNYFNKVTKTSFIEKLKTKFPEYTTQRTNTNSFINAPFVAGKKLSLANPRVQQLKNHFNRFL